MPDSPVRRSERRDQMVWDTARVLWLEAGRRTPFAQASDETRAYYYDLALKELSEIFCPGRP